MRRERSIVIIYFSFLVPQTSWGVGRRAFTSFSLRIQAEYFKVTLPFQGQKTGWALCAYYTSSNREQRHKAYKKVIESQDKWNWHRCKLAFPEKVQTVCRLNSIVWNRFMKLKFKIMWLPHEVIVQSLPRPYCHSSGLQWWQEQWWLEQWY